MPMSQIFTSFQSPTDLVERIRSGDMTARYAAVEAAPAAGPAAIGPLAEVWAGPNREAAKAAGGARRGAAPAGADRRQPGRLRDRPPVERPGGPRGRAPGADPDPGGHRR